jgi:chromosomal replication initiator protein
LTICDIDVVAALGQDIARRIGEPRFNLWFEGNTKFILEKDSLTVSVPNLFFQDWLQNTFADSVRAAAGDVLGRPVRVRFAIDPDLFKKSRRAQGEEPGSMANGDCKAGDRTPKVEGQRSRVEEGEPTREGPVPSRSSIIDPPFLPGLALDPPAPHPPTPTLPVRGEGRVEVGGGQEGGRSSNGSSSDSRSLRRTRRWRRLSDFVAGPCNRVAHASAQSVVELPGEAANPLVLYGTVGTGKTHLLEGIYTGLRRHQPEWRVCFVTSEDFTNRFVQAMRLGKLAAFRSHFRQVDALIIDDLHFLAGKRATQEEFLHTIDVLLAEDRQLVAACDCHPKLAGEFAPELTDRLLGGAVWGLTPPDADTRLNLLRAKAGRQSPLVSEEVLCHLAGQLRGNVRELEGALHSVRHFSRVTGRPIDLSLAREALGDLFRHSIRVLQLADVDRAICSALRLESGTLQSKQRTWTVSHPRMLAMYLSRKHTAAAYSEIGKHFGGRNHSTAVAAEKKVRQWLLKDEELLFGERRWRVRDMLELAERELLR